MKRLLSTVDTDKLSEKREATRGQIPSAWVLLDHEEYIMFKTCTNVDLSFLNKDSVPQGEKNLHLGFIYGIIVKFA